MPHLQRSSSTGRLLRKSSGHLRLRHPGYTLTAYSTSYYVGTSQADVTHDTQKDTPDYDQFPASVAAAISSMTSGGGGAISPGIYVRDIWGGPGMGYTHSVSAAAKILGVIYTLTGDPFGAPIGDITISSLAGISPVIGVGSGSSTPSGNPKDWTVSPLTASNGTTHDISLGAYIWYTLWVAVPGSYSSNPYSDEASLTLSIGNIQYTAS